MSDDGVVDEPLSEPGAWGEDRIRELLVTWSEQLSTFAPKTLTLAGFSFPLQESGTLATPATSEQIAEAEQRLGVVFPPSYRALLRISNGWYVTGTEGGVVGLCQLHEVKWCRDLDAAGRAAVEPALGAAATIGGAWLLVSRPDGAALVLDHERVDSDTGEWACLRVDGGAVVDEATSLGAALTRCHREFVEERLPNAATMRRRRRQVDEVYRRALTGDITARDGLGNFLQKHWRAVMLEAQWGQLALRVGTPAVSMINVACTGWPDRLERDALHDAVLMDEMLPLVVVSAFGWQPNPGATSAAVPVREVMTAVAHNLAAGVRITADFSYSPDFAAAIAWARTVADTDPDRAWQIIVDSLPLWLPRHDAHLAPLGLLIDTQLRALVLDNTPPRQIPPRALQLLSTPRGGAESANTRRRTTRSAASSSPPHQPGQAPALPGGPVLVRTFFGDDIAWAALAHAVSHPSEDGFLADVTLIDDRTFDKLTPHQLRNLRPDAVAVSFLADETTLTHPARPILAVRTDRPSDDDQPDHPATFRVVPEQLWSVENNLNLANMNWNDFAGTLGPDNIFRGFD